MLTGSHPFCDLPKRAGVATGDAQGIVKACALLLPICKKIKALEVAPPVSVGENEQSVEQSTASRPHHLVCPFSRHLAGLK